jgi:hypothetical protein
VVPSTADHRRGGAQARHREPSGGVNRESLIRLPGYEAHLNLTRLQAPRASQVSARVIYVRGPAAKNPAKTSDRRHSARRAARRVCGACASKRPVHTWRNFKRAPHTRATRISATGLMTPATPDQEQCQGAEKRTAKPRLGAVRHHEAFKKSFRCCGHCRRFASCAFWAVRAQRAAPCGVGRARSLVQQRGPATAWSVRSRTVRSLSGRSTTAARGQHGTAAALNSLSAGLCRSKPLRRALQCLAYLLVAQAAADASRV